MIFLMLFFSCIAVLHSSSNHFSFLFHCFSPSDSFDASTMTFLISFHSICTSCIRSVSSNFSFIFYLYKLRSSFFSLSLFHLSLPWFLSALDSRTLNVMFTRKWSESQLGLRHDLTSVILCVLFIITWSV
jgi:hypothetical protein